jgi:hypothetical protein
MEEEDFFLFVTASRSALGPARPRSGDSSPGVKGPESVANYPPLPKAEG